MNMHILFLLRDDLVFLLALQRGELDDSFLDDAECFVDILFADDEGRRETDDVFMGGFGLGGC
jgi:hypothetical protein